MIVLSIPVKPKSVQDKKIREKRNGARFLGNSKESNSYKMIISAYARQAMRGKKMIEGMVIIEKLYLIFKLQKKPKKGDQAAVDEGRFIYKDTSPDIDNLSKGLFDACNDVIWIDDKRVVRILDYAEVYGPEDEIYMEVREQNERVVSLNLQNKIKDI